MKNKYSYLVLCLIIPSLIYFRVNTSLSKAQQPFKVTTWDALGYYIYLPGIFIYDDYKKFDWLPAIDSVYQMSGGRIYQANRIENGNSVTKYLGGVAILELPFFFIGHEIALHGNYLADGFSPPYQYCISYGILFYFLAGLFILRNVLLRYFSDKTTTLTLLLIALASNALQYATFDSAQSHIPIFFLYALVIYTTIKWHEKPNLFWASATGYIVGLATISRPTEAIMFLIPLLWNTHTKEFAKEKWAMLNQNRIQVLFVLLFGLLGILPMLLYWKIVTGHFVYDVGSKWTFLNPFFRVLFGFEKGWFVYTPVTLFFVTGLFFVKSYPFRKSVIWFCGLNIYIIISWYDWRYGGSYSTRALVQSYPVFALALGAFIEHISQKKWRYLFYGLSVYFIGVNLFQVWQYNHGIIHYDHMNRQYYGRVYLNPDPSPLDMSLLDTKDWISNEEKFQKAIIYDKDSAINFRFSTDSSSMICSTGLDLMALSDNGFEAWLKVETNLKANLNGNLYMQLYHGDSSITTQVRLFNPLTKQGEFNEYAFYMKVPEYFKQSELGVSIGSSMNFEGQLAQIKISLFRK